MLIFVGISSTNGIYENADIDETNEMYDSFESSKDVVEAPLTLLGYSSLILGAFAAIFAFRLL